MPAGEIILWEFLGTAALLLIGTGVGANLNLRTAPGRDQGWLMGAITWGFAVFIGASIADPTGGHINPAVTVGQAISGTTEWREVPWYFIGQFAGAFVGAVLAYIVYKKQFDAHGDHADSVGIFATTPNIRAPLWNFASEAIATFVLVLFLLTSPELSGTSADGPIDLGNSALGYAGVAFVIMALGAGLGGPTGYALNPARDFAPRALYALLPLKGKGSADWRYAWVPLAGPTTGAIFASLLVLTLP